MIKRLLRHFALRPAAIVLAALSGVLYALGFCGYDQSALAWGCFVPLFWALHNPGVGRKTAVALAWITGLFAHLGCYTWIIYMLRVFGYLPWPLAVLGYVLLCLAQSGLFAAWGWLTHWLTQRRGVPLALAAPTTLVLAEWLFPALFPSFLSNALYQDIWAMQSLDVWGPLGLSGLLCLSSVVLYQLIAWVRARSAPTPWRAGLVFAVLFSANAVYGWAKVAELADTLAHPQRPLTVGLVQTNMGIYEKHDNPQEGLRRHRNQSVELQEQGAELIIWPESSYVYGLDDRIVSVSTQVMGPHLHTPLLFGGIRYHRQPGGPDVVYNTAFLTDADGRLLGHYDKNHLLMFGEMLPFGETLPWLYRLSPHTAHFTPGHSPGVLALPQIRLGVLICYEDILPQFVRRTMALQPEALVNLTNDAWFGHTREPRIHMALATFGAVSSRRYLVRATNTGISTVIDPLGRVVQQAPSFTRANLLAQISPMSGVTFYDRWGDWVAWLAAAWLLRHAVPAMRDAMRQRRAQRPAAASKAPRAP